MARRYRSLPVRGKLRVAWRLLWDGRVPWYARLLLPLVVLYLASPLDLVPDFIPVLGYLDDVLLVTLALGLFLRLCPAEVVDEHVCRWRDGRATAWSVSYGGPGPNSQLSQ